MSQSEQLIRQLSSRFLRKPRQCKKINDSNIGSAQRIVCISANTFYYYPKIQQFQDLDFDKLQYVVPKAGVKLVEILQLKFPPRRKNQRNYFSIVIPRNKILKYTKTYKQMIVDQYAQGQQQWTFYFDYDIISLPQIQARLLKSKQKQKQVQQIKQQQIKRQKQKLQKQKQKKIEQQYQSLKDAEMRSDSPSSQINQKILQRHNKQNIKKIINQADELSFHHMYRKLLFNQHMSDKQIYAIELRVLEKIGAFKERAQTEVRNYIDQLSFNQQKIKQNVFFRVNSNLYFKFGDKNLNQQFLANFYISLTLLKINKELKFQKQIRVPLFAFVKYKGHKVLVRSVTPVDNYNKKQRDDLLVHGNTLESWKVHFLISDDLSTICNQLNIASYNSEVHYTKVQIHLGTNLKLIDSAKNPFEEIKNLQPGVYNEDEDYKITYALDIDEVFPIDLDFQNNINQSNVRLRPQFVMNFINQQTGKPQQLSGGALFYALDDQQGQKQDINLAKAAQALKYKTIGQFVKDLDDLKFIPYNPQSFSNVIKQNGLNMRYLGRIYKLSSLPYVKQFCMIEAITRCIKKLFRQHQKEFAQTNFRILHKQLINQAFDKKSPLSLRKIRMKQLKNAQQQASKSNAIDFLNLIFGNTTETQKFWQIIKNQVLKLYGIVIKNPFDLAHGYLFFSVLYHCGFRIKIQNKIDLFMSPNPFNTRDWIDFDSKIKSFDYPSMKIYQKIKRDPKMKKQTIINRCQLAILIKRALKQSQTGILVQLSQFKQQIPPPKEKYTYQSLKYYLLHPTQQNFNQAHNICQFLLPTNHPMFLQVYLTYAKIKSFDPIMLKKSAKQHAIRNLGITHWKTSQLLSQFKQQDYIQHLMKAENGVSFKNKFALYQRIVGELCKQGKLIQATLYVKKGIQFYNSRKGQLNEQQYDFYFKILGLGIDATYKLRRVEDMLKVSQQLWNALQKIEAKQKIWYQYLLQQCMKVFLQSNQKKYYLFKLVLALQQKTQKNLTVNQRKEKIQWLRRNCADSKNHINYIKQLLTKLQFGYSELNFVQDFFIAFDKNVQKLGSEQFNQGLIQLSAFIQIYGVHYFEQALINKIYVYDKNSLID